MTDFTVPFNRPTAPGNELRYMAEAIASGKLSGDGGFTKRCHALLEKELAAPKVLLTTSCTHALEMSALLLDLKPGDEVILPTFTFVSTVNAFVLRGAVPVFLDVRPDTLNLDETKLEAAVTPKTRAIVPVHYAGVGCEMDAILDVASRHGLAIVEDNAQGLFGRYRGRLLGSFGALSAVSFHETKNFGCGEGGALVINDPAFVERAEIVREKGTNRSQFFRGQVDKYTWVDIGSSYLPSDLLAAFLLGQLERKEAIQGARRRIWERYEEALAPWAERCGVRLPTVPPHCEQTYHLFYLLLPSLESRERLAAHLKERGILAVFHYVPLHASPQGRKIGRGDRECPVATDAADRLLRLPLWNDLPQEDQERTIGAILDFDPHAG